MKISINIVVLFLLILFYSTRLFAQPGNYISFTQKSDILENHKKMSSEIDVYFDNDKRIITKHFYSPKEFLSITNSLGEMKIYYPSTNEVSYQQIQSMASVRNLIYYFVNNLTDQLGLADEGFTLISNSYEDSYYVTFWKAPASLKGIDKVKMVFENGFPIYSEYLSIDEKVEKKIYYTNYNDFPTFRLPSKIIEISYMPNGDSTVNRTLFSNVKVASTPDNSYFKFKIPENAKPLSTVSPK